MSAECALDHGADISEGHPSNIPKPALYSESLDIS